MPGPEVADEFGRAINDELPLGRDVEVAVLATWQLDEEPIALDLHHLSGDLFGDDLSSTCSFLNPARRGLCPKPCCQGQRGHTCDNEASWRHLPSPFKTAIQFTGHYSRRGGSVHAARHSAAKASLDAVAILRA